MSCEADCQAEQVLSAIFADLDEEKIRRRIDEPIEAVLGAFTDELARCPELPPADEILTQFVERIYRQGLRAPWKAADAEAMALMLLERHYRSQQREGYYAAVLDATGQVPGGLTFVLTQLAEIIRTKERQEYVNGVFIRRIDPSNWRLRCAMVEILRQQYRPLLPPELLDGAAWELADAIPELILRLLSSLSLLKSV